MMMKLCEKKKVNSLDDEESFHKFVESLKLTFADREMYFSGQQNPKVKARHLLNNSYLNKRSKLITDKAIEDIIPGDPLTNKSLLRGCYKINMTGLRQIKCHKSISKRKT
jgi:gamma-glutamyltranspeptidase/glutathione hydrolase